ncbi:hypothetical protein L227DRAFT_371538 [Lentinus tigrinus ALCF2SS1-6]|uniref:C2H2-type domain-containing protein n=1 Tax=Lentinus tigrinus ALCF2SS1-6 TaxID=1328759 RepID=A0A5C2RRV5_9APHY|nr:hypothetical protein L227DRAFT_371538 [Lentinus tigrinus ALCF2SS1-6]
MHSTLDFFASIHRNYNDGVSYPDALPRTVFQTNLKCSSGRKRRSVVYGLWSMGVVTSTLRLVAFSTLCREHKTAYSCRRGDEGTSMIPAGPRTGDSSDVTTHSLTGHQCTTSSCARALRYQVYADAHLYLHRERLEILRAVGRRGPCVRIRSSSLLMARLSDQTSSDETS